MSTSGSGRRPQQAAGRRLVADRRATDTAAKPAARRRQASGRGLFGLFGLRFGGGGGGGEGKPPKRPGTPGPARKPRRSRARRPRPSGPLGWIAAVFRLIGRLIWGVIWRGGVVVMLILGTATAYYYTQMPELASAVDARSRGSVTMLDREGTVFAWRGDQFGGVIDPDTVSPHLVNAIVATEDRRFYRHFGVSPRGIASAIRINLSEGRGPLSGNGGSTITQQVAKLMCLGVPYDASVWATEAEYEQDCRRTTVWRKIQELPFAMAMEVRYSKDEILSIYMNRAFLGAGTRGFEAAAQRYFATSSAALNPAQSAMLAGLLVAPSYYAPTRDLERAQRRAATIIRLMGDQSYLTDAQVADAVANPATLSAAARQESGGAYADWIMSTGPQFMTRGTTEDVVIATTFDPAMQAAAEAAIADVFATQVREGSTAQAAIVVMSADGAVRAMVGGRDTAGTGLFNRATQAMRQTGSSFKPFVYAAALDLGWRFDDMILDAPLTLNIPGSGPWSPENYTGEFYGDVTLTDALTRSLNTAAVRLSEAVGRDAVREVAAQFGIESSLADGPALALGASESTLIEMTGAFAGILNGGSAVQPYGVQQLRLIGDTTPLFEQTSGIQERVISEQAARQLTYMMASAVTQGTGRRAQLPNHQVAGKTGTTNSQRDAWFIGFTADYVAGVWMGYDDNTPLSGVTGGGLPAELWRQTMARIHETIPPRPLPMIDPAVEGRQQAPQYVEYGPQGWDQQQDWEQQGGTPPPRGTLLGPAPQGQSEADQIIRRVLDGLMGRN